MTASVDITEKVTVYEGTITLPTYQIKAANRNPVFRSQYGVAHIYPYTLLDDIEQKATDKTYRTLNLDNRYLRVTVIPDLGGRVYSLYDKISEREVFYKNNVVKFSPLAIRGAFFSGGLEFSFPVAHAPTTADPVNWHIQQNQDGSGSISIGGIEHISRLRWTITLTLFPDRCALAQDVQLYNPYSIPGRYHYWTNASLDADDQTEFIYPLRRVRSYEFAGTSSWPHARLDLIQEDPGLPGMEGVPMWPAARMQKPVNFRWQKNMLAQVSIFGRDVKWDFFGAWQHSRDSGYAHFANYRDVSGMKLWSWGNAPVGVVNQTALTDDGSVYAETQCGAMETQLDFDFLQPGKTRAWREWWLPLRGMGGLTCASEEVGARIHLAESQEAGFVELTIGACPAFPIERAAVQLSVPDKVLLEEQVDLTPHQTWLKTAKIPAINLAGHPLHVTITDGQGKAVLDYVHERDASPVEPFSPPVQREPESAEDFYQLGLKHENFDNRELALKAYQKALELTPDHSPAHLRLGLMHLRSANLAAASHHLLQADAGGMVEANYYAGIIARSQWNPDQAAAYFRSIPQGSPLTAAAVRQLGQIALSRQDWQGAIDLFSQAVEQEGKPISGMLLLGMALRRAGRGEEARGMLDQVLSMDPLNHHALRERGLLTGDMDEGSPNLLKRMIDDDRQYVLDLACSYLGAGLLDDALQILEQAWLEWPYAMVAYLAAYIQGRLGRESENATWLQKGSQASPDYVFPGRLEEVQALEYAISQAPQDANARYYLGNFYYAHERYDEGIQLWKQALQGLDGFDVLHRNLGLAAWQRDQDLPAAVQFFEKALSLNPQNQDLYLQLDELYKAQGLTEKREGLLEKIKGLTDIREDVHKRSIVMMVDLGHYGEALEIMERETFVPLEMDQSFHNVYVNALLMRAGEHLKDGHTEGAVSDYQKALQFPANLGVGAPTTLSQAHIYYHLGLAYEQLGRFREANRAWQSAAREHHAHGTDLFEFVQKSLDKLSRYSELGFE